MSWCKTWEVPSDRAALLLFHRKELKLLGASARPGSYEEFGEGLQFYVLQDRKDEQHQQILSKHFTI